MYPAMSFTRFVAIPSLFLEAAAVRVSGSLTTSVRMPLVLLIRRRSTSGEVELRASRPGISTHLQMTASDSRV